MYNTPPQVPKNTIYKISNTWERVSDDKCIMHHSKYKKKQIQNTKSQIPGKEAVTTRATAPKAERVTKNPAQPGDNSDCEYDNEIRQ